MNASKAATAALIGLCLGAGGDHALAGTKHRPSASSRRHSRTAVPTPVPTPALTPVPTPVSPAAGPLTTGGPVPLTPPPPVPTSAPAPATATAPSGQTGAGAFVDGQQVFPADNPWNRDISSD